MKQLTINIMLLLCLAFAFGACRNNSTGDNASDAGAERAAQIISELDADTRGIIESAKRLKPLPFVDTLPSGYIVLDEKARMIKPNYLVPASEAANCTTLSKKYIYAAILSIDKVIAGLYDMPVQEYSVACKALLEDCGDPAALTFLTAELTPSKRAEVFPDLIYAEYKQGREYLFWTAVSAAAVEQIYIVTRNIDTFLTMFTDEDVKNFSENLVCMHNAIVKTIEKNPEMNDLNSALCPLYTIDATTVKQFKFQLKNLEMEIFKARGYLLAR